MNTTSENTPTQNPATGERLAHGFRRTLFGFSPSFRKTSNGDKYGYLFNTNSATPCTDEHRDLLERLGRNMIDTLDVEDPAEFSNIDAGLTYFGQFVDHDLTLDVDSSTRGPQDARKFTNYRSPNMDLDSVYGDGPAISPFMYENEQLKLIVGTGGNQFDLPRTMAGAAIIGDPRNDENLFVAQFHMSMLRFHNAAVDQIRQRNPNMPIPELFELVQTEVRRHYQWVIVNDFLRTIVGDEVIDNILANGLRFFRQTKFRTFFMPVEFSVAAYRFGHSMIRNNYNFNRNFSNASFSNAFGFTKNNVPTNWVIDWSRFFGEEGRPAANKARKIDTRVAFSMGRLPLAPGAPSNSFFAVLTARNLIRGMALQVPTGQAVAKQMKVKSLTSAQLMLSPYVNPTQEQQSHHQAVIDTLQSSNALLLNQTPLWYYILKEAEVLHDGNQLGPVGGRIVAEVFLRMLADSKDSILKPEATDWKPSLGLNGNESTSYKIVDLLRFAGTLAIPSVS